MVILNKLKYRLLLCIIFIVIPSAIYYYQYYPRYSLGYSNNQISKHTWDSAHPVYFDFPTSLYYNRFDNVYNYKAYLVFFYHSNIIAMSAAMNRNENFDFENKEILERITCADIGDGDAHAIETLLHQYRTLFLNQLKKYQPHGKIGQEICHGMIAFYFLYYYNHKHYNLYFDKKEFLEVSNWLKLHDKNLENHLGDPFNWKNCDFSVMNFEEHPSVLQNWLSLHISSEFLRDMTYYETWIRQFRLFFQHLK